MSYITVNSESGSSMNLGLHITLGVHFLVGWDLTVVCFASHQHAGFRGELRNDMRLTLHSATHAMTY